MDIRANKILPIDNPSEYKIHFAVWNGEEQPLDVFVRNPEEWKGWNSWRGSRDDYNRRFIFSLMRYYHQPDKWLFGGIFEVVGRNAKSYTVNLVTLHQEYIGRILIHHSGPGVRGRAFCLERYFDELKISQLFDKPFEGEAFCGYENVKHSFSQLEAIIRQNKPDWKSALENVKGVYLIADKKNGKMYVGSAYGDSGIWSRWACYIGTGHGWNDELTKLINANGIDYARENFLFSILEFRSMRTDDKVIIDREQYWKRVLQTIVFGYNKN
jgi:hypothetical protein